MKTDLSFIKRVIRSFSCSLLFLGASVSLLPGVVYDNDTGRRSGIYNPGIPFGDQVELGQDITPQNPLEITSAYVSVAPNGYAGGARLTLRILALDGPRDAQGPTPGTELGSATSAEIPAINRSSRVLVPISATLGSKRFVWIAEFSELSNAGSLGILVADPPSGGTSDNSFLWVREGGNWVTKKLGASNPSNFAIVFTGKGVGSDLLRIGGGAAGGVATTLGYRENDPALQIASGSISVFDGTRSLEISVPDPLRGDRLVNSSGIVLTDLVSGKYQFRGTQGELRSLLESLRFQNTSKSALGGAHLISFKGDGLDSTMTVNLTAVNDPPTVVLSNPTRDQLLTVNQFAVGQAPVLEIPFSYSDPDSSLETLIITPLSDNEQVIKNSNLEISTSSDISNGSRNGILKIKEAPVPTGTVYPGGLPIGILVTDSRGARGAAVIKIVVNRVNQVPSLTLRSASTTFTTLEDKPFEKIYFSVSDDKDPNLTFRVSSDNARVVSGDKVLIKSDAVGNYLEIAPNSDQNGSATLKLEAEDSEGGIAQKEIKVEVSAVNDVPVLSAEKTVFSVLETETLTIPFKLSDADEGDKLTVSVVPGVGEVVVNGTKLQLVKSALVDTQNALSPRVVVSFATGMIGGPAKLVLEAKDLAGATHSLEFSILINHPPRITDAATVAGQNAIRFKVQDEKAILGSFFKAVSSREDLILPDFQVNQDADSWVLSYKIGPNTEGGDSIVTLSVSDADGMITSITFPITVAKTRSNPVVLFDPSSVLLEPGGGVESSFGVGDATTPSLNLSPVAIIESDPNKILDTVSVDKIVEGTQGRVRTFIAKLREGVSGTARVRVEVVDSDGDKGFGIFTIIANAPPTINVSKELTLEPRGKSEVEITVGDDLTATQNLKVEAKVVGTANFVAAPVVTIVPNNPSRRVMSLTAPAVTGVFTIEVLVTDEYGEVATSVVTLRTGAPPKIALGNGFRDKAVSIVESLSLENLGLNITDSETPVEKLVVSVVAENVDARTPMGQTATAGTRLIPESGIALTRRTVGTDNFQLSLTPTKGMFGTARVTIAAKDEQGAESTESVIVTVVEVKDPPVLSPIDKQELVEDFGEQSLALVLSDPDTSLEAIVVEVVSPISEILSAATIVKEALGAGARLVLKSKDNQFGNGEIGLRITDGTTQISGVVAFSVTPVNDPPSIGVKSGLAAAPSGSVRALVLQADSVGLVPRGTIEFEIKDIDDVSSALTLSLISANTQVLPASALVVEGTKITVSPPAGAVGVSKVTAIVRDAAGASASFDFEVRILPATNTAPSFSNFVGTRVTQEDRSLSIALQLVDKEANAAELVLSAVSKTPELISQESLDSALKATSGAERSIQLLPSQNRSGTALITFTLTDPQGLSVSRDLKIEVQPVNDAPTISEIPDTVVVNQDSSSSEVPFTLTDIDTELVGLKFEIVSGNVRLIPAKISESGAGVRFGGTGTTRFLVITPSAGQFGNADLTLRVSDGSASSVRTVRVRVEPAANTAPIVFKLNDVVIDEDGSIGPIEFTVTDVESARETSITVTSSDVNIVDPKNLVLVQLTGSVNPSVSTWRVAGKPVMDASGKVVLVLTATDPQGLKGSSSFGLEVRSVNDAPQVSIPSSVSVLENSKAQRVEFSLADVDSSVDGILIELASNNSKLLPVANLAVEGRGASRSLVFSPMVDQSGQAEVVLTAKGPNGGVGRATLRVNVTALVNQPPTLTVDLPEGPGGRKSLEIREDETGTVNIAVSDVELGTNLAGLVVEFTSSNTRLLPSLAILSQGSGANRVFRISPAKNQSGKSTIGVKVTDPRGASVSQVLDLTVLAVNDAPVFDKVPEDVVLDLNQGLTNLELFVSDIDNNLSDLKISAISSSNSTLLPLRSILTNGRFLSLNPAQDQSGESSVNLEVRDPAGAVSTVLFKVIVKPLVNTAPVIGEIQNVTMNESSTRQITVQVSDAETQVASLKVAVASDNPILLPNSRIQVELVDGEMKLTLRPQRNQSGSGQITVRVTDAHGAVVTREFTLVVNPVDNAPEVILAKAEDTEIRMEEDSTRIVGFRVFDADTATDKLTISTKSSNQSLFSDASLQIQGGEGGQSTRFLTLTPPLNASGEAVITLEVSDSVNTVVLTTRVAVESVNDLPTVTGLVDLEVVQGGTVPPVELNVADLETPVNSLSFEIRSTNEKILPSSNIGLTRTGGVWTMQVTARGEGFGVVPVRFSVTDEAGGKFTGTFLVKVGAVNLGPNIETQNLVRLNEDQATTLASGRVPGTSPVVVITDDSTPVSQLRVTLSNKNTDLFPAGRISLVPLANRGDSFQLRLEPAPNASGEDTVTITAVDREGVISTRDALVQVRAVNDLPNIELIQDLSGLEDEVVITAFRVADLESPTESLFFSAISDNEGLIPPGSVIINRGNLEIRPRPDASGRARITVSVVDQQGGVASRNLTVVINPVNDKPTINPISNVQMDENQSARVEIGVSDPDSDRGSIQYDFSVVESDNPNLFPQGSIKIIELNATTKSKALLLTPAANQNGKAVISLTINDGSFEAGTSEARFEVEVRSINQPPSIGEIAPINIRADSKQNLVNIPLQDPDGGIVLSNVELSQHAGLVLGLIRDQAGELVLGITADSTAATENQVTVSYTDADGAKASETFVVTVLAVNSVPELSGLSSTYTIAEDSGPLSIRFQVVDAETSPEDIVFEVESSDTRIQPFSNVTVRRLSEGAQETHELLAIPNPNVFGTALLTIHAIDKAVGKTASTRTSVTLEIVVTPVNDAPKLELSNRSPVRVALIAGADSQTAETSFMVSDTETSLADLLVEGVAQDASLIESFEIVGSGEVRLLKLKTKGRSGVSGTTLTLNVTDTGATGGRITEAATSLKTSVVLQIEFLASKIPPTISFERNEAAIVLNEDTASDLIPIIVGDSDTSDLSLLTVGNQIGNSGLISSVEFTGNGANRQIRIRPVPDQFGTTTITLVVRDSDGLEAATTRQLTVQPVNDAPSFNLLGEVPIKIAEDSGVHSIQIVDVKAGGIGENASALKLSARLAPKSGQNPQLVSSISPIYIAGASRGSIEFSTVANLSGSIDLEIVLEDGGTINNQLSKLVTIEVSSVNDNPVVESATQGPIVVAEGGVSSAFVLNLSDPDHALGDLSLVIDSSDRGLLPPNSIAVGSIGGSRRSLVVRPPGGRTGSAEIIITVRDVIGGSSSIRVPVQITTRPTLKIVPGNTGEALNLGRNQAGVLVIEVADLETSPERIQLTASVLDEADAGPLSSAGIQISRESGISSRFRAVIEPSRDRTGTSRVVFQAIDSEGGSSVLELPVNVVPPPATVSVSASPSSTVAVGTQLKLTGQVVGGTGAFEFIWKKGETFLVNSTERELLIDSATEGDQGVYSLVVKDGDRLVTGSITVTVLSRPKIIAQPQPQTIASGKPLVLDVTVEGEDPNEFRYQWTRNGREIPNANSASYIKSSATAEDSGNYEVIVTRAGTLSGERSAVARVDVLVDSLSLSDNFASAGSLPSTTLSVAGKRQQRGSRSSNNLGATREAGEPLHASKTGGKSVWVKWTAPANGIMQVFTRGSAFDTLLGAYQESSAGAGLVGLVVVDSDDDGGESFTSHLEFNATANQIYYFAVDGRNGAEGAIKFGWFFQETFVQTPDVIAGAVDVSAVQGAEVVFSVVAKNVITYQWYFNDVLLSGENTAEYRIASAQPAHVGRYKVVVSNGRNEKSSVANLVLSTDPRSTVTDKSFDVALLASTPTGQALSQRSQGFTKFSASAASGFRGTQVFNTFGASTEQGEPVLCDIIGGASQWSTYIAPSDGLLRVSTEGSNFDTLLGIFTGPSDQGFEALQLVGCDNNSGSDGKASVVTISVKAGTTYYIAVDGPNGESGIVQLSYNLTLPDIAVTLPPPVVAEGVISLSVPGVLGASYLIQSSANLSAWRTIAVTNAISNPLIFQDPESRTAPARFYRLVKP